MAEREIYWLPPEVIQELLTIDEDLESCDIAHSSEYQQGEATGNNCYSVPKDATKLLDGLVLEGVQFSAFGKVMVSRWVEEFNRTRKKQTILAQYQKYCLQAASFFEPSSAVHPAYALIKIVEKVCRHSVTTDTLKGAEIMEYESETLDYIGGYALRRVFQRFGDNPIIEMLSTQPKSGSLISLMEKNAGSLYHPSEDLSYFIQHVYLKLGREFSKNPNNINVKSFEETLLKGQYLCSFTDKIRWATSDYGSNLTRDIITYIMHITIKLLSKGFAKNLFQKIRSSYHTSCGLRSDLKRQVTK